MWGIYASRYFPFFLLIYLLSLYDYLIDNFRNNISFFSILLSPFFVCTFALVGGLGPLNFQSLSCLENCLWEPFINAGNYVELRQRWNE